ncbi:MAG: elongation factor Ts [Candidatus Portnoybacteria bacterium CG06_land_8_20_14_3_00_39_12]|uniref:Elongation factor Ts n=2 Tax=Candidatus Portnoyibacteriota TaxID=1817913 RepID=A0A2M8KFA3_9BACT|nr:MAG: elongation factor Ts [Candidatus Portnoybacteria bacterium CG06_land_8_20_14_3_00_39_12]PJE58602.1 MAG: elongation factor Ts [Candidatus Portnoybacteria bacterium CG10_big_fil_rev_8_21_14_0_10_40_22]
MINAIDVQKLRQKTGSSMMECKKALTEANGDEGKAIEILKKKGEKVAESKILSRETKSGLIDAYVHGNAKVGVLLELDCETDFVARNEEFKELSHLLCLQIAAMAPKYVSVDQVPQEMIEEDRRIFREQFASTNKPAQMIEQIVEGKIKKQNEEVCLLTQPFIKDQDKRVADVINQAIAKLGEKITVKHFVRYAI